MQDEDTRWAEGAVRQSGNTAIRQYGSSLRHFVTPSLHHFVTPSPRHFPPLPVTRYSLPITHPCRPVWAIRMSSLRPPMTHAPMQKSSARRPMSFGDARRSKSPRPRNPERSPTDTPGCSHRPPTSKPRHPHPQWEAYSPPPRRSPRRTSGQWHGPHPRLTPRRSSATACPFAQPNRAGSKGHIDAVVTVAGTLVATGHPACVAEVSDAIPLVLPAGVALQGQLRFPTY